MAAMEKDTFWEVYDMKKKVKFLSSLVITSFAVLSMAVSSFAGLQQHYNTVNGLINADAIKIYVEIPTAGSSTTIIRPNSENAEEQITTTPQAFKNTGTGDEAIAYNVSLVGYTTNISTGITMIGVMTPAGTYTVKTKRAYMAIQAGNAVAEDVSGDSAEAFAERFNGAPINIIVRNTTNAYKKVTAPYVTIKPGESMPVRVTGTINQNAEWASGDEIRVTPMFKITPNMTAK